ncbi:conjugative transposon protein TraJ [Roseivirga sp. BDSF3-8]|uniref:conjugative transposon protein TraJ n=1 Tax=Roseivirga sp. BDSF3-8 TaxID=3241598 RepID=UPI003531D9D7
MKKKTLSLLIALVCLSQASFAQGHYGELTGLDAILDSLYTDMVLLCEDLIGIARIIGGFAALTYIAVRVWKHIAQAEAVDMFPLLRPFGIGLAILLFPSVLALMNGILEPVSRATSQMMKDTDDVVGYYLAQKKRKAWETDQWRIYIGPDGRGSREEWYRYTHPDAEGEEGLWEGIGNDLAFAMEQASYNLRFSIKQWISEVLQVLFLAAYLCINTIRTFYLLVLSILGPIVLALSIFDGFQHTLTTWIARYVNVFMWLPVANIFGTIIAKIQAQMLLIDIGQIEEGGDTFFSAHDTAYMVFMLIAIVGYFTVPSVANYIVHPGGRSALMSTINKAVMAVPAMLTKK